MGQNEKKRIQIIDMMGEYKMTSPYTHEEVDLFIMLGSYLMYTVSDILLKIPYLEILREKQKQKG